jgi:hypothetical protein
MPCQECFLMQKVLMHRELDNDMAHFELAMMP